MQFDLVLLSLGGVQRFIAESRTTADVAGASEIVQRLAKGAAAVVQHRLAGAPALSGLIFPAAADAESVTNKIVFLAPGGDGPTVARAAVEESSRVWQDTLTKTFRLASPPSTPGMPDIAWVSLTGSAAESDYGALWEAAQQEMDGRKRARVFKPFEIGQSVLCAQSSGLPAATPPRHARTHERGEALSAAGWAKRHVGREDGASFPSTVSIASSVFRSRLLARAADNLELAAELRDPVRQLDDALSSLRIPGDHGRLRSVSIPDGLEPLASSLGAWVSAEQWDVEALAREYRTTPDTDAIRQGQRNAGVLAAIARKAGIAAPSPYFAVIVQDLDRLGRALGRLDLNQQGEVSRQLSALAKDLRKLIRERYPRAELIYTGGDDLLAFCPAHDGLAFARSIREQVRSAVSTGPLATAGPDGNPITASTGVVFAHISNSLQDSVQSAQEAIKEAKKAKQLGGRSRDALAVVVRRRGGERARTILPWSQPTHSGARGATELPGARGATKLLDATKLLELIQPGNESDVLSGGLGSDLERDKEVLSELGGIDHELLRAELIRLVDRHGGTEEAGDALCTLGRSERGIKGSHFEPVHAALVARFLTQEAR